MGLQKYIRPVEYSFYVWIKSIKDNYEPVGVDYYLIFVKNVCYFNARKWMEPGVLKSRIVKELPTIDNETLDKKLEIFDVCIRFYKTNPYGRGFHDTREIVKSGYYVERLYEKGTFIENIKPLPRIV